MRGLAVTAGLDAPLVDDATFTVRPGETVGLVGESGCGKSVTALAVLGLLPARRAQSPAARSSSTART